MKIYVISGGPGTGKTTTIKALKKAGFKILKEAARKVAEEKFPGKNIKEINPKTFQEEYLKNKESNYPRLRMKMEYFFLIEVWEIRLLITG